VRRVRRCVYNNPGVEEGRDGEQPDVLIAAECWYAVLVCVRCTVRRAGQKPPERGMLRETIRRVRQVLGRVFHHAVPVHDDCCVRV